MAYLKSYIVNEKKLNILLILNWKMIFDYFASLKYFVVGIAN